jgi:hypothetical protein
MPELHEKVVEATRAHQKGQAAQDYALAFAAVLERVVLGQQVADAVQDVLPALPATTQAPVTKAVQQPHKTQDDIVKVSREHLWFLGFQ